MNFISHLLYVIEINDEIIINFKNLKLFQLKTVRLIFMLSTKYSTKIVYILLNLYLIYFIFLIFYLQFY